MAQTKLNMTLLLRRDDFTAEANKDYVLQAGEPGYCTATKVFKVGDGTTTWKNLGFANKEQVELILGNYYTKDEVDAAFKPKQTEYSATGSTVKTITGVTQNANGEIGVTFEDITFPELPTEEDYGVLTVTKEASTAITVDNTDAQNPVIGLDINNTGNVVLSQSDAGLSANIDLSAYKTDTENELKYKQLQDAIAKKVTATNEFVDTVAQNANGEIEITTKSVDFSNYYTKAEIDLLPHENTAHTHTDGVGTKVTAAGGIDGDVKVNLNVAFDVSGNTVTMYDKDDESKTAIATIDATSFIKDGMLHDVAYDAATNKLTFTWNTDAGEKTDEVTLSDIIDPYVFEAGALLDVATEGTKVTYSHETVAAPAETAGEGRKYLTGVTTDGYGHITGFTTASEVDQDLSGYKTKQTVYNAAGDVKKTITNVNQNDNGEIEVTYSDIDFSHDHDAEYKKLQTALEAVATEKNTFIDTIAQNKNGEVTITTKAVDFGDYDTSSEVDNKIAEALQDAKDYADGKPHKNTTYEFAATATPLQFTVTPSEGDAQTVTLVAPTVDVGVTKVSAGTDITVTPTGGTGEVTVAHRVYGTGTYTKPDAPSDANFVTGVTIENGHVTGASVKSLAEALMSMEFIFDGGNASN
jgi:hypothetical protein